MFVQKMFCLMDRNERCMAINTISSCEGDTEYEKEASQLYHEISDSLNKGKAVYPVDDYLSSLTGVERIPCRYDSDMACFAITGRDHTRSVTFLLTPSGILHPALCSRSRDKVTDDNSYLSLIAGSLLSTSLALRRIQRNATKAAPVDIYFISVGDGADKETYQRFNGQSLKESILGSIGSGTHLVIIEPTGLRVCSVQKGCLVFGLGIRGRSHNPAYPWLGENPWDALVRFEESLAATMKPKHDIYPVEVGKAPPMTLSSFLLGYPNMIPMRVEFDQPCSIGERSSIEAEYYVSLPPEFQYKEFEEKLPMVLKESSKDTRCDSSVEVIYEEKPFREDPQSVIVKAISNAFVKLTGFEPIFEWLPYPVSAKDLVSSGFATDVVVIGPGDWTFSSAQSEKTIIAEALRASEILASVPYEVSLLSENPHSEEGR
jgi:acetylornithine deacetylase/succinyl-diaminopimelate desuccinylase-like protein